MMSAENAQATHEERKARPAWVQSLKMLVRRRIVIIGMGLVVGAFLVALLADRKSVV